MWRRRWQKYALGFTTPSVSLPSLGFPLSSPEKAWPGEPYASVWILLWYRARQRVRVVVLRWREYPAWVKGQLQPGQMIDFIDDASWTLDVVRRKQWLASQVVKGKSTELLRKSQVCVKKIIKMWNVPAKTTHLTTCHSFPLPHHHSFPYYLAICTWHLARASAKLQSRFLQRRRPWSLPLAHQHAL